jgi:hypothetical protein
VTTVSSVAVDVAGRLVRGLGGRFSSELGIDVDAGSDELERWALAATLFGARISTAVAVRTYRVLAEAGIRALGDAPDHDRAELIELLDRGGYARYDLRTATKLHELGAVLRERTGGRIVPLAQGTAGYEELADRLDALPGWGPVTVASFLRELRGVLPHADPPLDARARQAAVHLGLLDDATPEHATLPALRDHAQRAGVDLRDLEAALIRLGLVHHRAMAACPGGPACRAVPQPEP